MCEVGDRIDKPWGYEYIWAKTDTYVGKLLYIKKGCRLSLQYHEVKVETLFVKQGTLLLHFDGNDIELHEGQHYHIPVGKIHRMSAVNDDCVVMEVSTPQLDDVVRLNDDYGRQ